MDNKYSVSFKEVSKVFKLKGKNKSKKKIEKKSFYALQDITFNVKKGDVVGILGTNGSGKSTLSRILAGISVEDSGEVKINGEQALIAINTGLNNQLTGLENIRVKGALLGLSRSRINEITEDVAEFSELGDFLYQPVKKYSSGMKSRLGFSISIFLNPDIIIIDEALSVGDSGFSAKCMNKMNEFKEKGKTIFFVSHSLNQVKSFCNKGLWIEGGKLKEYGDIDVVSKHYSDYIKEYNLKSDEEKKKQRELVFNERIIEDKTKIISTRTMSFVMAIIITLILVPLSVVGYSAFKEDDLNNRLVKDMNYTFLIEGNDVSNYLDSDREYLKNSKGNTIDKILSFNIKKNGKINISVLPINTEFYYEKVGVSDEIRFLTVMGYKGQEIASIVSKEMSIENDGVFIISKGNLKDALNRINSPYEYDEFNVEDKKDFVDKNKYVFKQLASGGKYKINEFLSLLLEGCSDKTVLKIEKTINILTNKRLYEEIQFSASDFNVNRTAIRDLIPEDRRDKLDDNEVLLNKTLIYLNGTNIKENIYYKSINKKIDEVIKKEEEEKRKQQNIKKYNENNNTGGNIVPEQQIIKEEVKEEQEKKDDTSDKNPVVTPTEPIKPDEDVEDSKDTVEDKENTDDGTSDKPSTDDDTNTDSGTEDESNKGTETTPPSSDEGE
ncbi:Hypothetical protein CM240_2055 [Clostridium bornimense]|uniref:ABC transporter domain-containing protein n=1 Tax=Clostridium bornimense TaxID=1216932 RepID=W6RXN2_9CLOT|nr:ATP-binding cassette domain-containing protein [Clostridium bornimense]CDM69213.1 Hypothetical protein CM240_2055 [Clostridium bornimense]